jgi:hypothetical protein
MQITPEGMAQAIAILNSDGSVDAAGVQSDPHSALTLLKTLSQRYMAKSRQKDKARTEQEKTDCMLIAIFHEWCDERLNRGVH